LLVVGVFVVVVVGGFWCLLSVVSCSCYMLVVSC
jgi:hypothetical protein